MNMPIFSKKGALLAFVLLTITAFVYAEARPITAKVRAIRGAAKYSDNGHWKVLKVNDVLKPGATVQTAAESTVDLFVNNSVIRITPDTTMALSKLLQNDTGVDKLTETELYLKQGRILGNVKKLAGGSKYHVRTPNGITGIRGTDFDISSYPLPNGQHKLTVTSIEGTLVGSGANSQGEIKTAVINTGETWSPEEGIIPTPLEVIEFWRGNPLTPPADPVTPGEVDPVIDYVDPNPSSPVSPVQ
jgi:hypothetical protein